MALENLKTRDEILESVGINTYNLREDYPELYLKIGLAMEKYINQTITELSKKLLGNDE